MGATNRTDVAVRPVTGAVVAARPAALLDRPGWRTLRADPVGLVVGTLFALQAMTPSLMPRTWFFQAVASGLSGGIGYGAGVLLASLLGRSSVVSGWAAMLRNALPARVRHGLWVALVVAVPTSLFVVLVVASDWQRETRALLGLPPETSSGWLRAGPVILVIAVSIVAVARLGRLLGRRIAAALQRFVRLPRHVAQSVGLLVVVAVAFGLFDGVVLRWGLGAADATFSVSNGLTPDGVRQPTSPLRSGSPTSLSAWDTLGSHGQAFVSEGPSRERMASASGLPEADVLDPIRVYVGLAGGDTPEARADLAVRELDRTGAFDREVLCVITSTGTGWVEPAAPRALELMYGGNTAVVSTQYSYLPSWISFLVDRPRADDEGRALFDAVHARVEQMPEESRPKLLVYGISLGSTGSQAAFEGIADLRERTDGVLWAGPANDSRLWRELVDRRDPGTREVAPEYADGLVVRFGNTPEDLLEPDSLWLDPRVAFLVHPTDPVVWWSPKLLFTRPDWLEEPRGRGVSPSMDWYPVVTFWQLTVDLANAAYPPQGYGHNYSVHLLDAWALVAPPPGWTPADTARARDVFR